MEDKTTSREALIVLHCLAIGSERELRRLSLIIEKDLDKLDKIKKILFEEDLTYIEMTRKIRKVFGYGN